MLYAIAIQHRYESQGGAIYLYDNREHAIASLPEVVQLFEDDFTPEELEEIDGLDFHESSTHTYTIDNVLDKRSKP